MGSVLTLGAIQTSLRIPNNLDVHLLSRTNLVLQDVCPIYLFRFPWVLELTSAFLWLPKQKLPPCWGKCLDIRLGYLWTYYSWNLPAVWRINCINLFVLWSAQLVIFTCCRISWQKMLFIFIIVLLIAERASSSQNDEKGKKNFNHA